MAHTKQPFITDLSFTYSEDVLGCVGTEGSLRVIDARDAKNLWICYESKEKYPLTRVAWNIDDPNYIAVVESVKNDVKIIDMRKPGKDLYSLTSHQSDINGICWAPKGQQKLCSVSDDHIAFLWDLK